MNDKSCLLDATAHTLSSHLFSNPDIPEVEYQNLNLAWLENLRNEIGHDGSERGFHTQEIQDALRVNGIIMQRHELYPCLQLPPGPEDSSRVRVVPIYDRMDCADIFLPKINNNDGVLMVRASNGVHHALSFTAGNNTAYDVQKKKHIPLEDLDIVMFLEFITIDVDMDALDELLGFSDEVDSAE